MVGSGMRKYMGVNCILNFLVLLISGWRHSCTESRGTTYGGGDYEVHILLEDVGVPSVVPLIQPDVMAGDVSIGCYVADCPGEGIHCCRYCMDSAPLSYSKLEFNRIWGDVAFQFGRCGPQMKDDCPCFLMGSWRGSFARWRIFRNRFQSRENTEVRMDAVGRSISGNVDPRIAIDRHGMGTVWSYQVILRRYGSKRTTDHLEPYRY